MDWSLLTCARKGHITYAPDEPALRAKLHTQTPAGEAWRCLRCGTYSHGKPAGQGPASEAPLVLRGKQLRDAFIMKFFAIERIFRALVVGAAAYGVWRFEHSQKSIQAIFNKDITLLKPLASQFGWDLDHSKLVKEIQHAFTLKTSTLTWVAVALAVYALIELIEAIGLWMGKRWGEYFAVAATSFGLPLEIYDLIDKVTALRIVTLLVNIALVVYLLVSKRLFGIRGGKKAHEAHLRSESLLEVKEAAGVDSQAFQPATSPTAGPGPVPTPHRAAPAFQPGAATASPPPAPPPHQQPTSSSAPSAPTAPPGSAARAAREHYPGGQYRPASHANPDEPGR